MGEPAQWSGTDPSSEPDVQCALDQDFDEWTAWLDREVAAGRNPVPPQQTAQGISVGLGDADGVDPQLLAAICDPDSDGLSPQFGQDAAADMLPPCPVLAALTEAAVTDVTRLSDGQLMGVLQAARRQENREAWKRALVISEFARRRQGEFDAATARGVPVHCRPGQFPGEELAIESLLTPAAASHAIDDATDLATRLPQTLAGMAAGLIDEARAGVIAFHTRSLSTDDVELADEILAALAPALRLDQLQGKALALEKKLNPAGVKARQEHAKRTRQRVEVRREESGNASVAGREMDTSRALAAKAHMHGLALQLRRAGLPGTLDQLRLAVFEDLTSGRDPKEQRGKPPGRRPPDPVQTERFAAFLRGLNAIPDPIAKACCDHATAESRYTPGRKLAHLIRARTVTCDAPGCNAQAQHCDLDHSVPYPDGPSCQCNLGPKCRRHHRAKQSPSWKVEQPAPGVIRWTLPSGRTHVGRPSGYL